MERRSGGAAYDAARSFCRSTNSLLIAGNIVHEIAALEHVFFICWLRDEFSVVMTRTCCSASWIEHGSMADMAFESMNVTKYMCMG